MPNPSFDDIQKLFRELLLPFHEVERDLPLPIRNHQNDNGPEHSWSLAVLACSLAHEIDSSLDIGKICMLAVAHDLVEVYAGDTSVWATKELINNKSAREARALQKIQNDFSKFPWIANTIGEYEQKQSNEALFVFALDKFCSLLMLYMDKGYYYHTNKIDKKRFDKQFEPHRKKAHSHPLAAKYYEDLRAAFDAHPEYFYQSK